MFVLYIYHSCFSPICPMMHIYKYIFICFTLCVGFFFFVSHVWCFPCQLTLYISSVNKIWPCIIQRAGIWLTVVCPWLELRGKDLWSKLTMSCSDVCTCNMIIVLFVNSVWYLCEVNLCFHTPYCSKCCWQILCYMYRIILYIYHFMCENWIVANLKSGNIRKYWSIYKSYWIICNFIILYSRLDQ